VPASAAVTGTEFFGPWEQVISDRDTAIASITQMLDLATSKRTLAWRGVVKAEYPLHSSLYRHLLVPGRPTPDEEDVAKFEGHMLDRGRREWRFDNLSALELLAHLQHYGGPTRLIDVTFNPFVALWFAVEQKFAEFGIALPDDSDARLFAFDVTGREIGLDDRWGGRELPWAKDPGDGWRNKLPSIWRPPSYNERIPAQNSAFLVGGIPQVKAGDNAKNYRKAPGDGTSRGTWTSAEVRSATSVTTRMNKADRKPQARATPTFTLRIEAAAKPQLRQFLEKSFGYSAATLYPDLFGLAKHVTNGLR